MVLAHVRDQFLVEVTDTTAAEIAERGLTHAAALLELNALFTAWVETATTTRCIPRPGRPRWPGGTTGGSRPGTARSCPRRTR